MSHGGGGEDGAFGMMIIFFMIVLFVVWLFTGGQNHEEAQKPFIKSYTDTAPLQTYGPTEKNR